MVLALTQIVRFSKNISKAPKNVKSMHGTQPAVGCGDGVALLYSRHGRSSGTVSVLPPTCSHTGYNMRNDIKELQIIMFLVLEQFDSVLIFLIY